jgi:hypothetical protein
VIRQSGSSVVLLISDSATVELVSCTPDQDGDRLADRGMLYSPDYVVNAGGIVNVAAEYLGGQRRRASAFRGDR